VKVGRRDFLRGAALLAIAGRTYARAVRPRPPRMNVRAGTSTGGAQMPGATIDLRPDGTRDYVKLGRDLGAHAPHVFSIDNANRRFVAWVMISPTGPDEWPYLVFEGTARKASSIGDDGELHTATFELDASVAPRIARGAGAGVALRLPLDGGLSYAWRNGKGSRIALRIENQGASALRIPGASGARDSRFTFRTRGAAIEHAPVLDELRGIERLAPGAHVELECDLREWIEAAGTYDLECAFDGAIYPDTDDLGRWPEHAAETWDIHAAGALRVTL